MPTIELYFMPESPQCRLVEMVAGITGVSFNRHYINLLAKEQMEEKFIKLNPRHKVPFIIDGDLKLGESRAIAAYLANKYLPANNTLYPSEPNMRAKVDELLFYDDGTFVPSIQKVYYPRLMGPVEKLDPEAEKILRENLDYMNKHLEKNKDQKFYLGDDLTIADVAFAATLSSLVAFGGDLSEYPALLAYLERLKASIPKYGKINDEAEENIRKIIEMRQTGK